MDHSEQLKRFITQEAEACESADPEMLTVFGRSPVDWFHPQREAIGGLCISHLADGRKVTVIVCRPLLEYEPTIMQFWEGRKVSDHKAVYFCPNALLVVRPTEAGDELLIENKEQIWKTSPPKQ
jgi:hypothetical protein